MAEEELESEHDDGNADGMTQEMYEALCAVVQQVNKRARTHAHEPDTRHLKVAPTNPTMLKPASENAMGNGTRA